MTYTYKYNEEYGTLQQIDENSVLKSSLSMPKSDLNSIAQLNIKENILRKVATDVKIIV
jgi:hypothetical protein